MKKTTEEIPLPFDNEEFKEKWKEWASAIDVLTLSATPIPRTLHMSLVSLREMSIIESPPTDRFPVQTYVTEYDARLVRDAVMREKRRGGQVFFVYNRVATIERMKDELQALLPEINIGIAHGQMGGTLLENVMFDFYEGKYDVLLCSSLIENGLDVANALRYTDFLRLVDIYGTSVATDSRDPLQFQAHNYVVSEPYILDGLEFGWDHLSKELAWRVYQAQAARFKETGILTAVSEDNIDQAPYFVYNTVYTDGKPWNAITEKGEDASQFKSLSTKAVFGWHVLYETDYTKKLMGKMEALADPAKGWYSGLYEVTGKPNKAITANTNGIILEALAYKQTGQLMKLGK